MKNSIRFSIIIAALLFISARSFSQIRTLCIRGVVSYVDDMQNVLSGSVLVGDSISGTIKYDLSITDNNALVQVGDYQNTLSPAGMHVNINSQVFQTDSSNVDFLVETVNNYSGQDNIVFRSYKNLFNPTIPSLTYSNHIAWQLDDTNQTALSNTNLPMFIDLSAWQQVSALTITGENMFMDTSIFITAIVTHLDTCEVNTGIANLTNTKNKVLIYPNPFRNYAIVQLSTPLKGSEINIFNLYGQKVKTIIGVAGEKVKIDREDLQSGVYIIQLSQGGEVVANEKLIISD
ncbi:MAG: T9SS type A sorting domain-containing protein [Bacteroidetes bacterium]|nr:T9SS type A sorting domain-containing protein [Bacteroidota bacterium]